MGASRDLRARGRIGADTAAGACGAAGASGALAAHAIGAQAAAGARGAIGARTPEGVDPGPSAARRAPRAAIVRAAPVADAPRAAIVFAASVADAPHLREAPEGDDDLDASSGNAAPPLWRIDARGPTVGRLGSRRGDPTTRRAGPSRRVMGSSGSPGEERGADRRVRRRDPRARDGPRPSLWDDRAAVGPDESGDHDRPAVLPDPRGDASRDVVRPSSAEPVARDFRFVRHSTHDFHDHSPSRTDVDRDEGGDGRLDGRVPETRFGSSRFGTRAEGGFDFAPGSGSRRASRAGSPVRRGAGAEARPAGFGSDPRACRARTRRHGGGRGERDASRRSRVAQHIIHVSSYQQQPQAAAEVQRLRGLGIDARSTSVVLPARGMWYRVVVGAFPDSMTAWREATRLREIGYIAFAQILRSEGRQGTR